MAMTILCDDPGTRLRARIGQELCVSDWIVIDQARIDAFAGATGDHYWLHTDPARAARDGGLGGTIAHGFLTLSLLAPSCLDVVLDVLAADQILNYGAEGVRFITPVRCGARVRCRIGLRAVTDKGDGRYLLELDGTVEVAGQARPALAARPLMLATFNTTPQGESHVI